MNELVIDISRYDQKVDFEYWKRNYNLWGVIIKAGGNEGGRYKDSWLETHYNDAVDAGLHIGFYYYSTVTDEYEAAKDAEHLDSLIDGMFCDLPCYIDVEDSYQLSVGVNKLTRTIESFCDKIQNLGYYPGIYTFGSVWFNNMDPDRLLKYADWIAHWTSRWPSIYGDIGMWQKGCMDPYTGDIAYDDVGGNYTDIDYCVIDYPSKIKNSGTPDTVEQATPTQIPSEILNDYTIKYQAHVQNKGWLEWVKNGQIAGTAGYSARMEALRFEIPKELGVLDVSLHIQTLGWKEFHNITNSVDICGTVGKSKRIEAMILGLRNNTTGLKLRYQGHVQSYGWLDPVWEGEMCGTTGKSKRLEAVRIWLDDPNNPIDITGWNELPEEKKSENEITSGRAEDVINVAYSHLGYCASDDPEPGSLFGRWLAELTGEDWMAGPSREIFWCCMFASYCLYFGGVEMDGFPTQNTDVALNGGARKYALDNIYDVQYGDVIIFNWDWNSTTDHIGFATGPFDGYGFPTIEGNVSNAVGEKYRQMGNVAYVLRPPYADGSGSVSSNVNRDPKNNRDGGTLDIDGIGGWNTIIDWQHQLGTTEDGWISGQPAIYAEYRWGMSNVKSDNNNGSQLVEAVQKKIGATVTGYWDYETSIKLQKYLIDHGYSVGDNGADSYFGSDSVKGLQKSLNDKLWTK